MEYLTMDVNHKSANFNQQIKGAPNPFERHVHETQLKPALSPHSDSWFRSPTPTDHRYDWSLPWTAQRGSVQGLRHAQNPSRRRRSRTYRILAAEDWLGGRRRLRQGLRLAFGGIVAAPEPPPHEKIHIRVAA